jgi:hypothetical protein
VSLHRAGGAAELSEILKEQQQQRYLLETLKEQQQQLMTEQQQLLTEQQQNYQGLIMDLFHPTSSIASSKDLKRYRDGALVFYYGSSSCAEYTCMVTGMECSTGELVAGHIYRQQWPKSMLVSNLLPTSMGQCSCVQEKLTRFLTKHFGSCHIGSVTLEPALRSSMHSVQVALFWHHSPVWKFVLPYLCYLQSKVGITLHDPSNIIIMQSQLERAFDRWQWVVLPEGPDDYKVVKRPL